MKTNYVLIDFENVQVSDIEFLNRENFRILVFVGASQKKVGLDVAIALQRMAIRAEYIQISGNGPNALDFHIAFYIGKLSSEENSCFSIISKDAGFDPLIQHLKSKKVLIQRFDNIHDLPVAKLGSLNEKVKVTIASLEKRGQAGPKKLTTLANAIATLLLTTPDHMEVRQVIGELKRLSILKVDGEKVTYSFPSTPQEKK